MELDADADQVSPPNAESLWLRQAALQPRETLTAIHNTFLLGFPMRISFDISEDKELRDAVKELMREQVVSVIREVIGEQLQEIVEQKKRSFGELADAKARWVVDYLQSRMDATIRETMNPGGKNLAVTMIDAAVKDAMTKSVLKKIADL